MDAKFLFCVVINNGEITTYFCAQRNNAVEMGNVEVKRSKEKISGMSLVRQEGLRLMAHVEVLVEVGICMSSIVPGEVLVFEKRHRG